jgi:hypothetical protein
MMKTIIKKEVLENIFRFRFPFFSFICIMLLPFGMYINQGNHAKHVRGYNEQVRLVEEVALAIKLQDILGASRNSGLSIVFPI